MEKSSLKQYAALAALPWLEHVNTTLAETLYHCALAGAVGTEREGHVQLLANGAPGQPWAQKSDTPLLAVVEVDEDTVILACLRGSDDIILFGHSAAILAHHLEGLVQDPYWRQQLRSRQWTVVATASMGLRASRPPKDCNVAVATALYVWGKRGPVDRSWLKGLLGIVSLPTPHVDFNALQAKSMWRSHADLRHCLEQVLGQWDQVKQSPALQAEQLPSAQTWRIYGDDNALVYAMLEDLQGGKTLLGGERRLGAKKRGRSPYKLPQSPKRLPNRADTDTNDPWPAFPKAGVRRSRSHREDTGLLNINARKGARRDTPISASPHRPRSPQKRVQDSDVIPTARQVSSDDANFVARPDAAGRGQVFEAHSPGEYATPLAKRARRAQLSLAAAEQQLHYTRQLESNAGSAQTLSSLMSEDKSLRTQRTWCPQPGHYKAPLQYPATAASLK